jgi:hypothetical protein
MIDSEQLHRALFSTTSLVGGIAGIALLWIAAQAIPNPDPASIEQISRLGMVGLLAVAVVVLWRALQAKDAILMANYKSMADTLAANRVVVEKMAETLDRIEQAVDKLDSVRQMVKTP